MSKGPLPVSRRAMLAGGAALPFLRIPGARAAGSPGVLRFGLSSYPPSIQPWVNGGTASATVKLMIHRGLTTFGDDGALQGALAESWGPEGDHTWVFRLRDATFQNGSKVTSADVKWTIEQIAAERSTAFFRSEMQRVDRVDTPDDKTVRIVTKVPMATLPILMSSYHLPIICRTSSATEPVGAGPFMVKAQERGTSLDLVPFTNYYKPGLPKLHGIHVIAYQDENLRVAALQSGDVDLIEYVPWQSMSAISANSGLKLDAVDGPFMYLQFNGSKPPFNDAKVRQAVAHAVNRDEIVKGAFFGRGSGLEQLPIAEASPFYNADFKHAWHYDPALARKLLADAGHAGGFSCSFLSTAQYGMHKDTAEIVQQHLAAVGIKTELNLPDWATRINVGNRGQYDLAVNGTAADNNDPDGLASLIDGSLPASYVRSFGLQVDRITELLAAGRAEFDQDKRRGIYREMEGIAIDQAPVVGLTWRSQGYAMRREVSGFRNLPGALTFYSGLTFETTDIS